MTRKFGNFFLNFGNKRQRFCRFRHSQSEINRNRAEGRISTKQNYRAKKMKFATVIILVAALSALVDHGDCWRRRRRRRSGGGRWGINNGGVTYTFRNGVKVTGYGSLRPKSVGIKVTIPFGRKRREVEEQGIPLKGDEKPVDAEGQEQELAAPTIPQKTQETRDLCAECVEVKPYKIDDTAVENETMANNDFVMVAKFIEENKSAAKMEATIKFEVYKVLKSPVDTITAGETFTINAKMASCPCLTSLEPGHYVVMGSVDSGDRLVLSNVLLEFEE